jgi:Fe(3+) dicitrate transport protein
VASAPRDFVVYGTEPQYSFKLDGSIPQKIMIGTRLMREEVDYVVTRSLLPSGPQSTLQDRRFENDAIALYASDTFSLMDGRLNITPGLRYENIALHFRNNQNGDEDNNKTKDFLPGLDLAYQVTDDLFAFANFHKSLRPVQFVHIVNNGEVLGSERAKNYELGVRFSPSEKVSASVVAFRIDFDNKIERDPAAGNKFRNIGKARHSGIETTASWQPAGMSGLTLAANYTYVDTEQLSGANIDKDLPYAPHHQLGLQSNYEAGDWNLNLNGSYSSSAFTTSENMSTENAAGTAGPIPSYWVWNTQVTKDFRWSGTKMQAASGINNILDEDYYFRGVDYSSGRLPGPGRAVMLSLKTDF